MLYHNRPFRPPPPPRGPIARSLLALLRERSAPSAPLPLQLNAANIAATAVIVYRRGQEAALTRRLTAERVRRAALTGGAR